MGRVITFAGLPYREAATGVKRAPITGGDMKEMSAEVIRVARGAALTEDVPEGSDRYLFTLTGGATVSGRGRSLALAEETFAVIEEGTTLTITNPNAGETTLISVLAPPAIPRSGRGSRAASSPPRAPPRPCTLCPPRRSSASISSARARPRPSAHTR